MDLDTSIVVTEQILNSLESLLRGGQSKFSSQEFTKLLQLSYELLRFFSNFGCTESDNLISTISHQKKRNVLEVGVRLHNKSRNLSAFAHTELRAVLKAASAYMFANFGERTPKVLSTVVKLFRKSGEDFRQCEGLAIEALLCLQTVGALWSRAHEIPYLDQLPQLEMQELKLNVYHCFLTRLQILSNIPTSEALNIREIKLLLSSIMGIISSVPIMRHKITLVEILLNIGYRSATEPVQRKDSITFFKSALDILESARENSMSNTEESAFREAVKAIKQLKLRAYLSLTFLHIETDEISKAMAYLNAVESIGSDITDNFLHTVLYAKVMLTAKEKNFEDCELNLKSLLKLPSSPFQTAISAVKQYFNKLVDSDRDILNKTAEIYKLLAGRYSKDPEFTTIRITHLQTILKALSTRSEESSVEQRAREIALRIMSDNMHGEHRLPKRESEMFMCMIIEQVQKYQNTQRWQNLKHWCDILEQFSEGIAEERDKLASAQALKVEALLQMNSIAEALDAAQKSITKEYSTKTLVAYFKALLYSDDIPEIDALDRLSLVQSKIATNKFHNEESLSQIIICCYTCKVSEGITKARVDSLYLLLLKYWVATYKSSSYWKVEVCNMGKEEIIHNAKLFDVAWSFFSLVTKPLQLSWTHIDNSQNETVTNETLIPMQALTNIIDRVLSFSKEIQEIIILAREDECALSILGSERTLISIADLLVALSQLAQVINGRINPGNTISTKSYSLLKMISGLLESAEYYYDIVGHPDLLQQRVKCLITAAAAQLDQSSKGDTKMLDNAEDLSPEFLSNEDCRPAELSLNDANELAKAARLNARKAQDLLMQQIEFGDLDDRRLNSTAIILELASYSQFGDIKTSEAFILSKKPQILSLEVEDLQLCIDILSYSKNISSEGLRNLIEISLIVTCRNTPVHPFAGWLYQKLIELSPSRNKAWEAMSELEIVLNNPSNEGIIPSDAIDQILSTAYNYAITLVDLDHLELAEKFMVKAIAMIKHGSNEMKKLSSRFQDTLSHIEKIKNETGNVLHQDQVDTSGTLPSTNTNKKRTHDQVTGTKSPDVTAVGHLTIETIEGVIETCVSID